MVRINWRFVKLGAEAKARLKLRSKVRFSRKLGRCYHRKCKILMEFCWNLFVTRHTCNHWVSSLFLLPEPCLLALWFEPYRWYLEPSKDQKTRIRNKFVASCSCAELVLLKITAWFKQWIPHPLMFSIVVKWNSCYFVDLFPFNCFVKVLVRSSLHVDMF